MWTGSGLRKAGHGELSQRPARGFPVADPLAMVRTAAGPALEALVRLDTVLMLGVIFFAYAPDATRQDWVADRLDALMAQCRGAFGG